MGINLSPTTLGILLDRGSLHLRMNNEAKALSDYNEVLKLSPEHTEALFFRAYIYTCQRLYKQARTDYENLIRKEPNNIKAWMGLILLNDKDNRPNEAMEQMNAIILQHPEDATLYALRAGMKEDRKLYEDALSDLNKAIAIDDKNPEFRLLRACYYQRTKQKKLAKADFEKAIELGASPEEIVQLIQSK